MITLTFQDQKFQAEFSRKIMAAKRPRAMLLGAGREVANQLKRHFTQKEHDEPNKLSARRSHFWLAVRDSVQNPELTSDSVTVTINHPAFAQKVFGGAISAQEAGALTIPVEERAYGRNARTFEAETGLKLFLVKTGKGGFANAVLAVKDNNSKGFTVEYLLTQSVTQKADPDALPDKTELERAILKRSQNILDRQMASDNPESINPDAV